MIARFKAREITGPEVYAEWDGCLIDDMLSEEGNAFSQAYFDFDRGSFLRDYQEVLARGLPSLYHVANTWQNFDRLRTRLDERFSAWRRRREKPASEFWRR